MKSTYNEEPAEGFAGEDRPERVKDRRFGDMRPVLWWLAIALLVIALGVCVMVSEGKVEHDCSLDIALVGADVTLIVHEAYQVYKDGDMVRWEEIKQFLIDLRGGYGGQYVGTYDIGGSWVLVSRIPNGYYVQIGDDWTVGDDGQLHSPRCDLIVPSLPGVFQEIAPVF